MDLDLSSPQFWIAVGQIIMIDILLGGDNAVVIALACRKLAPAQRTKGIIWGTLGAIVLRVILIFFALTLLAIPYLKIVGAILLLWIGVKLLLPEDEGGHDSAPVVIGEQPGDGRRVRDRRIALRHAALVGRHLPSVPPPTVRRSWTP